MKFVEYIKNENKRALKFLGLTLMTQVFDSATGNKSQYFLNNLIITEKVNDIHAEFLIKNFKIFNKSVFQTEEKDIYRNFYFLGKKIRTTSILDTFKKRYLNYFDKKYDGIYILNANSGEIYLLLTYLLKTMLKNNRTKTPLLVVNKKYHIDMIKMICPEIPYLYMEKIDKILYKKSFKIDDFNFYMLFPSNYFKKTEFGIRTSNIGEFHYFKSMMEYLDIKSEEIELHSVKVPEKVELAITEKAKEIDLNLDNFVFIAPEANSCKLYDDNFWVELIKEFNNRGIDVFVNIMGNSIDLSGTNYKTCDLSYSEAFALAKKSKKIISLRSGLTEFLLQTGVPSYVLYTKFKNRDSANDMDIEHIMSGFKLTELPFVNKDKVYEYDMEKMSKEECLSEILKDLS